MPGKEPRRRRLLAHPAVWPESAFSPPPAPRPPFRGHFAGDEAGSHRIDRDAPVDQLFAKCPGQPNHPRFAGRVICLARVADQPRNAGHVDDPTILRLSHDSRRGSAADEATGQVGRDHVVPLLVRHPPHQLVTRDSGIVDQDIQSPMLGGGRLDRTLWRQPDR